MVSPKNLYLYLHTHWDREWYLTHEEYRTQLTFAAADILNKLKTGSIPSFLLDGQACIIEDLEEVVPRLCDEIRLLVSEKKLEAGPWYVLADQMLVSGESLLRNLETGLAVTSRYGSPTMIGYCPDTFGHSQDLPRILDNFDIKTAFVWRGVPERPKGPLFWWQSTDGSRVLTYHLARGYYQAAFHDYLTAEKLTEFFLSWGGKSTDFNALLVPVGGDHLSAPNNFNRQLEAARLLLKIESMGISESGAKGTVAVQSCGLSDFADLMLDYAKNNEVDTVASELRDNEQALANGRAFMLAGVLSTRMYLKLQNRLAEKRLARILEPLFCILDAQELLPYPQSQLSHAWRMLMRNHPHDSMCGCSVDAVHREMTARFEKVHAILNVLVRKAFESMALDKESDVEHLFDALASHAQPAEKPVVARKKVSATYNVGYKLNDVEHTVDVPQLRALSVLGLQSLVHPNFAASKLLIANLSGEQNIGPVPISWCEEVDSDIAATSVFCPNQATTVQVVATREEDCMFTGTNQIPDAKKVRVFSGYVQTQSLPTYGFNTMPWRTGSGYGVTDEFCRFAPDQSDVSCAERRLSNEFFAVEVDTAGDIIVTNKKSGGAVINIGHHLRDVGDGGDSYNFDPLAQDVPIFAKLISVETGKNGPLVASLRLVYKLQIPDNWGHDDSIDRVKVRSTKLIEHIFETEVLLKKSVPILFFETTWHNRSRNHRLEVVLGTGSLITKTFSENHFSLVARDHDASEVAVLLPMPQGAEAPLDRFPCQRFFLANGQAFFNNGLPEYGVDGASVSITLLRAISYLSRSDLRTRGGDAGPALLTDEANCIGLQKVEYAWAPLDSASYGEVALSTQDSADAVHPEAQIVLEHLAQSASLGAKYSTGGAEHAYKALAAQKSLSAAEDCVVNAYRLCEIFEGLSWSCFTKDVPLSLKSHVSIENPAIRVVAMRALDYSSEVEIRLLNVLSKPQATSVAVYFAHHDARLTYADGRLIKTLVAKDENPPIIKGKGKKKLPNERAHIATYPVDMGANALISLRLKQNKG